MLSGDGRVFQQHVDEPLLPPWESGMGAGDGMQAGEIGRQRRPGVRAESFGCPFAPRIGQGGLRLTATHPRCDISTQGMSRGIPRRIVCSHGLSASCPAREPHEADGIFGFTGKSVSTSESPRPVGDEGR